MNHDEFNAISEEEALVRMYIELTGVTEVCARSVLIYVQEPEPRVGELAPGLPVGHEAHN